RAGVGELLLAVDDAGVVDARIRVRDVEGFAALRGDHRERRGGDDVRVAELLRGIRIEVRRMRGADGARELRDRLPAHVEGRLEGELGSLQVCVDWHVCLLASGAAGVSAAPGSSGRWPV